MSTNLRIDSFADINIVERGLLSADVEAGATSLKLVSTQDFATSQVIYVGHPSREGIEKTAVQAVTDETTIELSGPLKLPRARSVPVTAVLAHRIKICRAHRIKICRAHPETAEVGPA